MCRDSATNGVPSARKRATTAANFAPSPPTWAKSHFTAAPSLPPLNGYAAPYFPRHASQNAETAEW